MQDVRLYPPPLFLATPKGRPSCILDCRGLAANIAGARALDHEMAPVPVPFLAFASHPVFCLREVAASSIGITSRLNSIRPAGRRFAPMAQWCERPRSPPRPAAGHSRERAPCLPNSAVLPFRPVLCSAATRWPALPTSARRAARTTRRRPRRGPCRFSQPARPSTRARRCN